MSDDSAEPHRPRAGFEDASAPAPLAGLTSAARRAVRKRFHADAHARLRDLLSAVAVQDRAAVARLAAGLALDAATVGQESVRAAALALARAADSGAPLGTPALALTRALADFRP